MGNVYTKCCPDSEELEKPIVPSADDAMDVKTRPYGALERDIVDDSPQRASRFGSFYEQIDRPDLISSDIFLFSACKDEQTSMDVEDARCLYSTSDILAHEVVGPQKAGGVCTNAVMRVLDEKQKLKQNISWGDLLLQVRKVIAEEESFTQIPQLSTSRALDLSKPFTLRNPKPSGRERALLIGCNYSGMKGELLGCHNDVMTVREHLDAKKFAQEPDQIRILLDSPDLPANRQPTKANIESSLSWLAEGAAAGDSLVFHFSGHGGQKKDLDGDEDDGYDETLVPIDYKKSGHVLDDTIFALLVKQLPYGVHLFAMTDCCHSGSVFDLPYEAQVTANGVNHTDREAHSPTKLGKRMSKP